MYNRLTMKKKIANSFLDDEENREETPFKNDLPHSGDNSKATEKEELPKMHIQKRIVKNQSSVSFYGAMIIVSSFMLLVSLLQLWYLSSMSSLLGVLLGIFGLKFTEPVRWHSERLQVSKWNLSVTISVFIKSLHPRIFAWRKRLLSTISVLFVLSMFVAGSLSGVFFSLIILLAFVYYAARDMENYVKKIHFLSWTCLAVALVNGVITSSFSVGLIGLAFLLYQIYERLIGLDLSPPETIPMEL